MNVMLILQGGELIKAILRFWESCRNLLHRPVIKRQQCAAAVERKPNRVCGHKTLPVFEGLLVHQHLAHHGFSCVFAELAVSRRALLKTFCVLDGDFIVECTALID